jgi:hypothetical protein
MGLVGLPVPASSLGLAALIATLDERLAITASIRSA